jgi:PAS domain S-box-containing protein
VTASESHMPPGIRKGPAKCRDGEYLEGIDPRLRQIHKAAAAFGVFVLDLSGNVMSWNTLATKATGYRAEEILGRNLSWLYPRDEAANDRLATALAIARARGHFQDQTSLLGKNANVFCAEVTLTPVGDANRDPCGFACMIQTFRDLSTRPPGEIELARLRDATLESARLKSAFLANISHEFRTPLNIIVGYSDLIGEHLAEVHDTSQNESLEAVGRACKRLLRTLNALLDYSKLETRSLPENPQTVALVPLIRGLLDEFEPSASQKALRLAFEFDDHTISATCDEYCLTHSLRNLIENAIKFTERGGATIRVYREASGAVCISVADTGIGIERTFLPHLLEPFAQEDSGITRRFEGAGLGLALTRRYLELSGAQLTVLTEKGLGSTFTIHFARPPHSANVSASAARTEPQKRVELQKEARWPLIFVVEDDLDNQLLMRAMLQNRYRVIAAASPEEVRRQIASDHEKIDAILMDLGLRGPEDGLMLTRALRHRERFRTTPIIALTGHAMVVDRESALAAGCDDFIAKPFDRATLLAALERLLPRPSNADRQSPDTGQRPPRHLS